MCNGYWYECDCKECQKAKSLYEEYENYIEEYEKQTERDLRGGM